jgi:hypothetical protein
MNTAESMTSPKLWPNYLRVRASILYPAVVIMRWITTLKWKSFCMLKDDTTSRSEFGNIVLDLAENYNIKVANENIDLPVISKKRINIPSW